MASLKLTPEQVEERRVAYNLKKRKWAAAWRAMNREKTRKYMAAYREENREAMRAHHREYKKTYQKDRDKTDVHYRLRRRLSTRIRDSIRAADGTKRLGTISLIGCSVLELKVYLESLFKPGMTWDNYGQWKVGEPMKWHIDHIRPCASFDLTDPDQQRICFHYTNLQPLWALENITKSDTYTL